MVTFIAANPSSIGLRTGTMGHGFGESLGIRDGSTEKSTVTEQSGGGCGRKKRDLSYEVESSKIFSAPSTANDLNSSNGKQMKTLGSKNENSSKTEVEASSTAGNKTYESSKPSELPKDYIHVRPRRGQATDAIV